MPAEAESPVSPSPTNMAGSTSRSSSSACDQSYCWSRREVSSPDDPDGPDEAGGAGGTGGGGGDGACGRGAPPRGGGGGGAPPPAPGPAGGPGSASSASASVLPGSR